MILGAGFSAFYLLFLRVDFFIKFLAIAVWIDCFFSTSPYESFTRYVSIVGCCYFYYVCRRVEDWKVIFNALQAIVLLTICLMALEITGHDTLLNFNHLHPFERFAILGQHMQEASFCVVICAMLIQRNAWYLAVSFLLAVFCHSPWAFFCTAIGAAIYFYDKYPKIVPAVFSVCVVLVLIVSFMMGKFSSNWAYSGRIPVWTKTIELSNKKPLFGWGPGMYKVLFPVLSRHPKGIVNVNGHWVDDPVPYKTAHDFIAELLFEVGYPITIFIVLGLALLALSLLIFGRSMQLAGLMMILTDALVHFPERQLQDILIIIAFLAYIRGRK